MLKPKVGFIVFGVHKDGLLDPMGTPFVDDALIAAAKAALRAANVELVEHDVILATKAEARACLNKFKKQDDLDAIVLFSGTWVWAAHLVGALRDFAATRLADFKVPRKILFMAEIPKGATGKLQRIGLAAKLGLGA